MTMYRAAHLVIGGSTAARQVDLLLRRGRHRVSGNQLDNPVALDLSKVPAHDALGLWQGSAVLGDQEDSGNLRKADMAGREPVQVFDVLECFFEAILRFDGERERFVAMVTLPLVPFRRKQFRCSAISASCPVAV